MPTFDPSTWYVLTSFTSNPNNTLTAGSVPDAFNPNRPKSVYYAPFRSEDDQSQQWQIWTINASSTLAYILRNRQVGAEAFMTSAWSNKKCGGGNCATVPVLSSELNAESLWVIADWGFNDKIGLAYIYNLGNGSNTRLDQMEGRDSSFPQLIPRANPQKRDQHWNATAVATFAATDSTTFSAIPTAATSLLAQAATDITSSSFTTLFTASRMAPVVAQTVSVTPVISLSSPTDTNSENIQKPVGLSSTVSVSIGAGISTVIFVVLSFCGFLLLRHYQKRRRRSQLQKASWVEVSAMSKDDMSVVSLTDEELSLSKPDLKIDTSYELPTSPATSRPEIPASGRSAELPEYSSHPRVELDANKTRYEMPTRKSGAWM